VKKPKHLNNFKTLENAFLNAQQMSIQQAVHLCLSIPYIIQQNHFNFINICQENDRTFVLLFQKTLNKLSPNSIDIHCKSLIKKYTIRDQSLHHFSLAIVFLIMILNCQNNLNKIKLYIGFHLVSIKIQKFIIKNNQFYLSLSMDQKIFK